MAPEKNGKSTTWLLSSFDRSGIASRQLPRDESVIVPISSRHGAGIATNVIGNAQRIVAVVGAPRGGTTSLSAFLKDHPQICFSIVKEPHYFSQFDLSGLAQGIVEERIGQDYLARFFPQRGDHHRMLAEGSVSYLYAPERMEPILRYWPDARFVIAVRDPLELLPSLHQRLLYQGDEVVADFEQAWRLASSRAAGRNVPPTCLDPRCLQYGEIGRLGKYVDRFMSAVGRERCFVAVFDDLAADPADVYRRLLSFLDLPYHDRQDFGPYRTSLAFRIAPLQRLLKRPPAAVRNIVAGEKYRCRVKKLSKDDPAFLRMIFAGRAQLLRWNTRKAAPAPLSDRLRSEIRELLRDDIAHLSQVIGRDLLHWLGGKADSHSAAAA